MKTRLLTLGSLLLTLTLTLIPPLYAQDTTTPSLWLMPKPKSITDNGASFNLHRPVRLTDPLSLIHI